MEPISITFDQLIGLATVCLSFLVFLGGIMRYMNTQVHARMSKMKQEIDEDLDHIKQNYAQRIELHNSVESVKDILSEMKGEYKRTNDRMDDMIKWLMSNFTKTDKK